jgi:ankyrin repeat protein
MVDEQDAKPWDEQPEYCDLVTMLRKSRGDFKPVVARYQLFDINTEYCVGGGFLVKATIKGDHDVARWLIAEGADRVRTRESEDEYLISDPILLNAVKCRNSDDEFIEFLLSFPDIAGTVNTTTDNFNHVALTYASSSRIVMALVKAGADINRKRCFDDNTTLEALINQRHNEAALCVLALSSNAENYFDELESAVMMMAPTVLLALIAAGVDPKIPRQREVSETMLHVLACSNCFGEKFTNEDMLQTLQILLNVGVDIRKVTKNGFTAMDFAKMRSNELLFEHMSIAVRALDQGVFVCLV